MPLSPREGLARICPKIRGVAVAVLSEIEAVVSVYQVVVAEDRAIVSVHEPAVSEDLAVALVAVRCPSFLASNVGSVGQGEALRFWIAGPNRVREWLERAPRSRRSF